MEGEKLEQLKKIFEKNGDVKLAYFFGSQAVGNGGPLSDYDFAVFLDEKNIKKAFEIKFRLMDEISRALKTDKIDVVVLDIAEAPELKYNVIKNGHLIFEREPYKVLVEPKIINEYFDFRELLLRNNLTRA